MGRTLREACAGLNGARCCDPRGSLRWPGRYPAGRESERRARLAHLADHRCFAAGDVERLREFGAIAAIDAQQDGERWINPIVVSINLFLYLLWNGLHPHQNTSINSRAYPGNRARPIPVPLVGVSRRAHDRAPRTYWRHGGSSVGAPRPLGPAQLCDCAARVVMQRSVST